MLSGETRLVGLLGFPLSHSLSPRMQNAAFAARGLDWTYVPLPVEPGSLEAAAAGLVALGFAGANVTIPHKTALVAYCDELDEVAERAGSVNTLVVRDGRLLGSSTDGAAVVEQVDAGDADVLVLGAGGAAQAVATALVEAGCSSLRVAARNA
ncbi:MAG: shikimate dehydrogenase family protein, partial [Gaiellaceae bacterium]